MSLIACGSSVRMFSLDSISRLESGKKGLVSGMCPREPVAGALTEWLDVFGCPLSDLPSWEVSFTLCMFSVWEWESIAGGDCYLPVLPQQKVSKWTQNTLLSLWLVMAALCCSNEIRSQRQMKELHLLIACTTAPQKRNWWHHFGKRALHGVSGRISQVNIWTAARAGNTRVKWAEKDAVHFSSGWTSVTDKVH